MKRVCIIGYGNMGRNHKRVLESMGHEVDTVDCNGFADYTIVHSPGFKVIPNPPRPDATVVAVPIDSLAAFARHSLQFGPVLVEKPAALAMDELSALHAEAKATGHHLAVGYTERFNPALQSLADHLHRVGRVQHIALRRLGHAADHGGDPALDLATHDLDVLDALGFNLTLKHVARSKHHVSALLRADHRSPLLIPGEPSVSIEASHLHPNKVREMEVVGDHGVLQLDFQKQTLGYLPPEGLRIALNVRQAEPLKREWEAFFNGEGSDGVAALTIAEQMADSS